MANGSMHGSGFPMLLSWLSPPPPKQRLPSENYDVDEAGSLFFRGMPFFGKKRLATEADGVEPKLPTTPPKMSSALKGGAAVGAVSKQPSSQPSAAWAETGKAGGKMGAGKGGPKGALKPPPAPAPVAAYEPEPRPEAQAEAQLGAEPEAEQVVPGAQRVAAELQGQLAAEPKIIGAVTRRARRAHVSRRRKTARHHHRSRRPRKKRGRERDGSYYSYSDSNLD